MTCINKYAIIQKNTSGLIEVDKIINNNSSSINTNKNTTKTRSE